MMRDLLGVTLALALAGGGVLFAAWLQGREP